jgi:hypothetical protein
MCERDLDGVTGGAGPVGREVDDGVRDDAVDGILLDDHA